MAERYFITGIGTGIGKTIVSAILTEKLKADYWKPVQAGDLEESDSLKIADLISNSDTVIHPERFRLNTPCSPHLAAKIDKIEINLEHFILPETANTLLIEGAGGLMVPLNSEDLMIDLIKKLAIEVILVSQNYLGSINHTLLTINALKQQNIPIKGILFNGEANLESENYILNYSKINCLGKIPTLETLDKHHILAAGNYVSF